MDNNSAQHSALPAIRWMAFGNDFCLATIAKAMAKNNFNRSSKTLAASAIGGVKTVWKQTVTKNLGKLYWRPKLDTDLVNVALIGIQI